MAMALMDSLSGNEPLEYIKDTLNKAYALSDRLLDAKVLLSRFANDDKEREKILVDAIKHEREQMENATYVDDFFSKQYLRALVELDGLYREMNCLPLRMKTLQAIYHFKPNSLYNSASKLYCLYLYFDRIEYTVALEGVTLPEYKYLAKLIYHYERNEYVKADEYLLLLKQYSQKMIDVFKADDNDPAFKEETKVLRELAYYINRNNRVIDYIIEGE